jgi:hypothetical protein
MKNKIIGVLMGGVSSEREISLRSGRKVAAALEQKGYQIKNIDIVSRACAPQLAGIGAAYISCTANLAKTAAFKKFWKHCAYLTPVRVSAPRRIVCTKLRPSGF